MSPSSSVPNSSSYFETNTPPRIRAREHLGIGSRGYYWTGLALSIREGLYKNAWCLSFADAHSLLPRDWISLPFFLFCFNLSFVLLIDIKNILLPTMKISNLIMAASAASLVHARDVIKKRASGFTCKHPFPLTNPETPKLTKCRGWSQRVRRRVWRGQHPRKTGQGLHLAQHDRHSDIEGCGHEYLPSTVPHGAFGAGWYDERSWFGLYEGLEIGGYMLYHLRDVERECG